MGLQSLVAALFLATTIHASVFVPRDRTPILEALPQRATENDLKWQPYVDVTSDSCYNVTAIDAEGNIDKGLPVGHGASNAEDCRYPETLQHTNVYSRQRCNNGWCAYMYDYYMQKDVALSGGPIDQWGHRHEWEHVVVWVQNDEAKYVSMSQHGEYKTHDKESVLWDGTHPKVVYFKEDWGSTHYFRPARDKDHVENASGDWVRSALISYNGFPDGIRKKLFAYDFGGANMAISDNAFANDLKGALPGNWDCISVPKTDTCVNKWTAYIKTFDCGRDDGSPGDVNDPKPSDPTPPPNQPPSRQMKVMIVGDSISQGHEGDYTWRYRIWQWFKREGIDVDFVGPYRGTFPQGTPHPPQPPKLPGQAGDPYEFLNTPTNGGYAKDAGDWDSDHYAAWGRQLAQDKQIIEVLVNEYQPDYLFVLLGFNDVGWWVSDAHGTLDSMTQFVVSARQGKQDVNFLIGNIPMRTHIGGRDDLPVQTEAYNSLLKDAVSRWNQDNSRVALVDVRHDYACEVDACPAGHDGLHPNAAGEYQIAIAFVNVLIDEFHIGNGRMVVSVDQFKRDCPTPSNLQVEVAPYGFKLTWDLVYGAFSYDVRSKYAGGEWGSFSVDTNRHDPTWAVNGFDYSFQIRTNNGDMGASDWSEIVTAKAHLTTLDAPAHIYGVPTANGAQLAWDVVPGATVYEVILWDKDTPGAFIYGTGSKDTYITFNDLKIGHSYAVGVSTWNNDGPGFPKMVENIIPGAGGAPPVPSNLVVKNVDATTVSLSWTGSSGAAGYRIWIRSISKQGEAWRSDATTDKTTYDVAYLFPGTWTYEYCVSAFNGILESGKTTCVTPPKTSG